MPPAISIITPTLNQGGFLARCIASVRDQPGGLAEHIIMDGGSTDGTLDLLRSGFEGRWRSAPDRGQSHAINMALGVGDETDAPRACAPFGTWLNADDWLQPRALGPVASFLADHPEADVLICNARFVAEDGRTVFEPQAPDRIDEATLLSLRSVWFAGHSIAQPEVFFRLSLFRDVGGLDELNHHSMDHHLWLKFLEAGARFRRLDIHVANQGVHAAQKTADRLASTRCIVRSSRAWLDRRSAHWPLRAPEVRREIEAIESKLRLAERYASIIDTALGEGDASREPAGAIEVVSAAVPQDWPHALRRLLDKAVILGAESIVEGSRALVIAPPSESEEIAGVLTERGIVVASSHDSVADETRAHGPVGLLVAHAVLTGATDPVATLRLLSERVVRGGIIILSAEVERSIVHDRYLSRLRNRAVNKITQPDLHIIGPRADLSLRPLLESADVTTLERHPNPRGIDPPAITERLALRIISSAPFGRLDMLPLAPFPTVPKLAPHIPATPHLAATTDSPRSHAPDAWVACAIRVP